MTVVVMINYTLLAVTALTVVVMIYPTGGDGTDSGGDDKLYPTGGDDNANAR